MRNEQSNSANPATMTLTELAAWAGQLTLAGCEPHRALLLDRVNGAVVDPFPPTVPTVVLLRVLGALAADGDAAREVAASSSDLVWAR